jgi:hypothetical protein
MLDDCCWNLSEEVSIASYKCISYKKKFETWLESFIFSHFFCVIARSYFHTSFLQLFFNFLCLLQCEKVILN